MCVVKKMCRYEKMSFILGGFYFFISCFDCKIITNNERVTASLPLVRSFGKYIRVVIKCAPIICYYAERDVALFSFVCNVRYFRDGAKMNLASRRWYGKIEFFVEFVEKHLF